MNAKTGGDCRTCFYYGKSYVTGRIECTIAEKMDIDPTCCTEYVKVKDR